MGMNKCARYVAYQVYLTCLFMGMRKYISRCGVKFYIVLECMVRQVCTYVFGVEYI